MELAPIALFVYNRPEHTQKTIESLLKNKEAAQSYLYIFSDGAKSEKQKHRVEQVRTYIRGVVGFKQVYITERKKNTGLAKSIISGVSEVIAKYKKVVVLEDDLIVSPNFIRYMNDCLKVYRNDNRIFSISAYCAPIEIPDDYPHDVFLFRRINSWGWATWQNRWEKVDWMVNDFEDFITDRKTTEKFNRGGEESSIVLLWQMQGKINSWAIRFYYSCFKNNGMNVYPVLSKVKNIGADGSGSHVEKTKKYDTKTDDGTDSYQLPKNLKTNSQIEENYRRHFKKPLHRKIINSYLLFMFRLKLCIKHFFQND